MALDIIQGKKKKKENATPLEMEILSLINNS